jgi:hypothetical protein
MAKRSSGFIWRGYLICNGLKISDLRSILDGNGHFKPHSKTGLGMDLVLEGRVLNP